MGRAQRVVVVDDNELTLPGFVTPLEESDETDLVGAIGHAEALTWASEWCGIDVVVVDAADERLDGDQFPGVAVVRRVREHEGDSAATIIVVTGHYLHDGLRYRMADAGADLFFFRRDLHTAEHFLDVVTHPERYRRGVPPVTDAAAAEALGVDTGTRIEHLVGYVDEHGLARALRPDQPAREAPRSRRWTRHRQVISDVAGVKPVNVTTGMAPQGSRWPSIRQVGRLWSWAARVPSSDGRSSPDE